MLYADGEGVVYRSRNNLAKIIDMVAVCASFGLTVSISEAKREANRALQRY